MSDNVVVDIAIVGGGLVGSPLATMLSQQGWSVALLDKQSNNDKPVAGTRGFTALSHFTVQALSQHGLWHHAQGDACAINEVHVSHKGYFGSTRVSREQQNVDALGHVVDNADYLSSLQIALAASSVTRLPNATVESVDYGESSATLHYRSDANTQVLSARLVIAVDGVSSRVREAAGIGIDQVDYEQVGVMGVVQLSQSHNHVAYERFTPSGPLALLPRPNNTASYVYCIHPEQQDSMAAMSDHDFLGSLQEAFGFRLGRFESIGPRVMVPLVRIEARAASAPRLLLLGNALRLLHPVAGQGYNLAMRDVLALLDALPVTISDPGSNAVLQPFVESRKADHQSVVRLTDALARTFRGSASIPAHIRALGLIGLDSVPALRNRFTRRSMGYPS